MGSLAWQRAKGWSVAELAQPWLDARAADSELLVAVPADEGVMLGAFERSVDAAARSLPVYRRASGGAAAYVGPGTVFVQLALRRVDALVPCAPDKLLNRYVRPLLRALTRASGRPAHYFGRDWIAVEGRPVASVSFGHDASLGSAVFEAVVAVSASFATTDARAAFMGKLPGTLAVLAGRAVDPQRVADQILDAYRAFADSAVEAGSSRAPSARVVDEPPWQATREEVIGTIAAGRDASGRLRLGGELMASRDAVGRLEDAIAVDADGTVDVEAAVDRELAAPGVVTFGVRALASIRDVLLAARGQNIA